MRLSRVLIISLAVSVAGCSSDKGVRNLTSSGPGPDEFLVMPGKPLEQPKNYAMLPPPTPGEANRTDLDPMGDAVVALGGSRVARNNTQGIGSSDGALVSYASRAGRDANIRQTVLAEDANFRKRRGRFTNFRIVKQDRYNEIYRRQELDAYSEWWRWRKAGARTPAAPPNGG
ncbi:DUF3035 domain-containing protein [Pseudopelagicola sp. nBUS_20]|uniref:DUF3035 domain-containing protein n=1 Tax=Pseudopelagicola sp. nBUS_20 TaxID=3395317 RepID=UPI003EB8F8C0